jgi:hypothetical protein
MKKTILKCGAVGAVILFLWMMFTWMALPIHQINHFSNESNVSNQILSNAPQSGLYMIPSQCDKDSMQKGPLIFASVSKEDSCYCMVTSMIKELVVQFIGACVITWLLFQTKLNFKKSVGFITLVGVLIAWMSAIPHVIWFRFPAMYAVGAIFESAVGWFLAGLAICKLAKR